MEKDDGKISRRQYRSSSKIGKDRDKSWISLISFFLSICIIFSGLMTGLGTTSGSKEIISPEGDVTPKTYIFSPNEGEVLSNSSVTIIYDAYVPDNGPVFVESSETTDHAYDGAWMKIDGGEWKDVPEGEEKEYTFSNLSEGEHRVDLEYKNGDIISSSNVTFTIDFPQPHVEITAPNDGDAFYQKNIVVEWEGNGSVVNYKLRKNEDDWIDMGTETSHEFVDLSEGEYTVEVKAENDMGITQNSSVTFYVDRTDPYVDVNSPTDNGFLDHSSVNVTWNCTAGVSGIDHYEVNAEDSGQTLNHTLQNLDDGEHAIQVTAIDNAGNSGNDEVKFVIDTVEPHLTITQPNNGSYLNESRVTVKWNSDYYGDSGLDHYEVNGENSGELQSHTLEGLDDGEHTIEVTAIDNAGNSGSDEINFIVDTSDPQVTVISPNEGSCFNQTSLTMEWEYEEVHSGVDHFKVDGEDSGQTPNHTLKDLEDGEHTVEVTAIDNAGNSGSDEVTFTVDTTDPEINITSPEEGNYLNDSSVEVDWNYEAGASGIDQFKVDGEDSGDTPIHTLEGLDEGEHTVKVTAIDKAGNSGSDEVNFTVDTSELVINITSPEEGDYVGTKSVEIVWNYESGPSGIDRFEVNEIDVGNTTSYNLDLEDGQQTVVVRGFDNAGNSGSDEVTITVDTTDPEVNIISPEEGSYTNESSVEVAWDCEAGISGLDQFKVDGEDAGKNATHTLQGLEDTEHTVEVTAIDKAGNSGSNKVNFTVDTTVPDLDIIAPEEGDMLNSSSIVLNWTIDSVSPIEEQKVRSEEVGWIRDFEGTYYQFEQMTECKNTLHLFVEDGAGNQNSEMVNVTIDREAPSLDVLTPEDGHMIDDTQIEMKWNVTDDISGLDRIEVRLDDDTWSDIGKRESCNFTELAHGDHTIYILTHDRAGNQRQRSLEIKVDIHSPEVEINEPDEGAIIDTNWYKITWSGSDDYGIRNYRIRLNDEDWIDKSVNYHNFSLSTGEHTVYVQAYDEVENMGTTERTFVVKPQESMINMISPVENKTIIFEENLEYEIKWGTTKDSSVEYYELRRGSSDEELERIFSDFEGTSYRYEFDHNETVYFELTGYSDDDRALERVEFEVEVDLISSEVEEVEWEEGDQEVLTVDLPEERSEDVNVTWIVDGEMRDEGAVFVPDLEAGDYTIKAEISDGENCVEKTYEVQVHPPNGENDGFPMIFTFGGIGILLILILPLMIYMKARDSSKEKKGDFFSLELDGAGKAERKDKNGKDKTGPRRSLKKRSNNKGQKIPPPPEESAGGEVKQSDMGEEESLKEFSSDVKNESIVRRVFEGLERTTEEHAYQSLVKKKGEIIDEKEFEDEIHELVKKEKLTVQPRKDLDDIYKWND